MARKDNWKEKVNKTLVELTVGEDQVLFVILGKDGSINRQGNGNAINLDHDLHIGVTKDPLFSELINSASMELFEYLDKSYDLPDKKGKPCKLKILFHGDNLDSGLEINYGEHSQGPPEEVAEFVINSVKLTEP